MVPTLVLLPPEDTAGVIVCAGDDVCEDEPLDIELVAVVDDEEPEPPLDFFTQSLIL